MSIQPRHCSPVPGAPPATAGGHREPPPPPPPPPAGAAASGDSASGAAASGAATSGAAASGAAASGAAASGAAASGDTASGAAASGDTASGAAASGAAASGDSAAGDAAAGDATAGAAGAAAAVGGYAWWYVEVHDAAGRFGLTFIVFAGSVFSPRYAARLRAGVTTCGLDVPAVNFSLYERTRGAHPSTRRAWVMNEYPRAALTLDAHTVRVANTALRLPPAGPVTIELDEDTTRFFGRRGPRVQGRLTLAPLPPAPPPLYLGENARGQAHYWQPLAPRAAATVELQLGPRHVRFQGLAYLDRNYGSGRLEDTFSRWGWAHGLPAAPADPVVVHALDAAHASAAAGALTPGSAGVLAPGSAGVLASGSAEVLAPGSAGVLASGSAGALTPGSAEVLAPGAAGVLAPGAAGVLAPARGAGDALIVYNAVLTTGHSRQLCVRYGDSAGPPEVLSAELAPLSGALATVDRDLFWMPVPRAFSAGPYTCRRLAGGTLEDTPFYARFAVHIERTAHDPAAPPFAGVGEYLDLDRFRRRSLQFLLRYKTRYIAAIPASGAAR